jgi:23S rRNA (guanosine2251-2'-O)-methyltransferase
MISQRPKKRREISLALHNIRSVYNVGAIFRTADAAGVSKIYLCGYTPAPIDRFGRARKDVAKAALGAEKTVVWESVEKIDDFIKKMKKEGFKIFALEQDETSVDYKKAKLSEKNLLILGEEVSGIEKEILKKCDEILEIPMKGEKESLNVSVAAGVALFALSDKL